jgi:hypothetical protein
VEAFDGGAFVTVRLNAEKAELKFWAAGGNLYPGWNVHDKMPNKKVELEMEMPEPIEWDPASMENHKFLKDFEANIKTKLLGKTEIKSRANWGEPEEEGEKDDKKMKRI